MYTIYQGDPLKEDEYLLKVDDTTGFITKLNKNGTIPVAFKDWRNYYNHKANLDTYLHKENFSPNWHIVSCRFGESQNWAIMMHPIGFTLEIYINNFMELIKHTTIINGELQGEFKWENKKLLKK